MTKHFCLPGQRKRPEHKLSESQQSRRKYLKIGKCLSMLKMQQQLKVGEKQRAFYIIDKSPTVHFSNVNLTNAALMTLTLYSEYRRILKLFASLKAKLSFYTLGRVRPNN